MNIHTGWYTFFTPHPHIDKEEVSQYFIGIMQVLVLFLLMLFGLLAMGISFFNRSDVHRGDGVDIEDLAMTSGGRRLQKRRDRGERMRGSSIGSGGGGTEQTAAQKRKVNNF